MTAQPKVFLDDLVVGTEYCSEEYPLDEKRIVGFAQEFDPQPFHLDDEAARDTLFKGLAASGWHTAAITMKLMASSIPFANGLIGAGGEIAWPQPTRPSDVLHVVSKILDITPSRSKPHQGMVTVEIRTLNQNNEVRQKLVAKMVVMRRPEA